MYKYFCPLSVENLSIVMNDVIQIVNFIKGRALNSRLFSQLCADYNADEHLIFYSSVRWLSRGSMLKRVYELRLELSDFLQEKNPTIACYGRRSHMGCTVMLSA